MTSTPNQIEKLLAFKETDKFSDIKWGERGLMPSDPELSKRLQNTFNNVADDLIVSLNQAVPHKQLKSILKTNLKNFDQSEFDTEEKEFICDVFFELAAIVNVDLKSDLNKWLYGALFSMIQKLSKFKNAEEIVETLSQPCIKCGIDLKTYILEKKEGIPDHSWEIIKCKACNQLNLFSHGPNIFSLRFDNYELIESLSKDDFNYEQALTRLEQIKI